MSGDYRDNAGGHWNDDTHSSKARSNERRSKRYNERNMLNNINNIEDIDIYDDRWYE